MPRVKLFYESLLNIAIMKDGEGVAMPRVIHLTSSYVLYSLMGELSLNKYFVNLVNL